MSDQPVLAKSPPAIVTHVHAALGPIDLKDIVRSPTPMKFVGELADGRSFPDGVMCTESGLICGIPVPGTEGNYDLVVTATNDSGLPLKVTIPLTIKESLVVDDPSFFNQLKAQVWKAISDSLPLPDVSAFLTRPITAIEVYYLLQRYAVLTIWDVYNLDQPGEKILLSLEGTNKYYHIYDRGSCLVAAPKDLFTHERTLADALDVSRTLAREAYKRNWTIEFAGFNKMVRAAWVELQLLGDQQGRKMEILHYTPTPEDLRAYSTQVKPTAPGMA